MVLPCRPKFNPMHSFLRIPPVIREPLVPTMLAMLPPNASELMTWVSMASELLVPVLGVAGMLGWSIAGKASSLLNL